MARNRPRWLMGTAAGALIAICFGNQGAQAQGVLANGAIVSGSARITQAARRTDVAVTSREAIIDWTIDRTTGPVSNAESPALTTAFLPTDNKLVFVGAGEGATAKGFTVLNRLFLPGTPLLDGRVESTIGPDVAGNVWFYSPNGLFIGANARFTTGSMLLTANAIETSGGLLGAAGEIRFRGVSSLASVEISRGAVINTIRDENSYLAIVAPRIVQAGRIRSNGPIALVAAESADLRFNVGLVDVVVQQGTDDSNGIVQSGVIETLPYVTEKRVVALSAIPKNDALTMLLSGTIGYEPASQATAEGTSIVLTAGNTTDSVGLGNIQISDATFLSSVRAFASNRIDVTPSAGRSIDFQFASTLSANRNVTMVTNSGGRIRAQSSLDISAGFSQNAGEVLLSAVGGSISADSLTINASGPSAGSIGFVAREFGELTIDGDLFVKSSSGGLGFSTIATNGSVAIGGSALIETNGDISMMIGPGGHFDTRGTLTIDAGGAWNSQGLLTAGAFDVSADGGIALGAITSDGTTSLRARNGAVSVSGDLQSRGPVEAEGVSIDLVSSGSLDLLDIVARSGSVTIAAAGDLRADGALRAADTLRISADGSAELNAKTTARTISIASQDITIGEQGQIGERGSTRSIELVATGSGGAVIGDSRRAGSYELDADETGRLFADQTIRLDVSNDLEVGTFELTYGPQGALEQNGVLALRAGGTAIVSGSVTILSESDQSALSVEAGRVEVTGGIAIRDSAGERRGKLTIDAPVVIAAEADLIPQIDLDNVKGDTIGTLLGKPASSVSEGGFLSANTLAIQVRDALLVQNTGGTDPVDRRGFSASALSIVTTAPDAIIAINGQTFDAGGGPVRGANTLGTIALSGDYSASSSVNGCSFNGNCSGTTPRAPISDLLRPPTSDIIRGLLNQGSDGGSRELLSDINGLRDGSSNNSLDEALQVQQAPRNVAIVPNTIFLETPDPARQEPLLDQPITGIGNDDLWNSRCEVSSPACPTKP